MSKSTPPSGITIAPSAKAAVSRKWSGNRSKVRNSARRPFVVKPEDRTYSGGTP